MKQGLIGLMLLLPMLGMGQLDSTRIVLFRHTGLIKSAAACEVTLKGESPEKLRNNSVLILPTSSARKRITISLDKHQTSRLVEVPEGDTLFLEVELLTGRVGILPSSRFIPSLNTVPKVKARKMLTQKWAKAQK